MHGDYLNAENLLVNIAGASANIIFHGGISCIRRVDTDFQKEPDERKIKFMTRSYSLRRRIGSVKNAKYRQNERGMLERPAL